MEGPAFKDLLKLAVAGTSPWASISKWGRGGCGGKTHPHISPANSHRGRARCPGCVQGPQAPDTLASWPWVPRAQPLLWETPVSEGDQGGGTTWVESDLRFGSDPDPARPELVR